MSVAQEERHLQFSWKILVEKNSGKKNNWCVVVIAPLLSSALFFHAYSIFFFIYSFRQTTMPSPHLKDINFCFFAGFEAGHYYSQTTVTLCWMKSPMLVHNHCVPESAPPVQHHHQFLLDTASGNKQWSQYTLKPHWMAKYAPGFWSLTIILFIVVVLICKTKVGYMRKTAPCMLVSMLWAAGG